MKKILIITQKVDKNDSILGFFHAWINEFAKQFENVTIICLWKGRYDLPNNVKVLSLGKEERVSRLTYILRLYKYIWCERKNYDTVFVHMNPIYVLLCGPLWKILGKKVSLWYTHKHVDLKLRLAEKIVDQIFSASKVSFRLNTKKLKVMGHGIDTEKFSATDSKRDYSTLRVITVGRISETKNLKVILDAIEILKKRNIPVIFELIGGPIMKEDFEYLDFLKNVVTQKGLDKEVLFLGEKNHEQIKNHLLLNTVFVNMSYTGSLDKAVLEAMACELPVVTSNEAYLEMLKDFDLLIRDNDPMTLADKMSYIFHNKERSNEIGKRMRDIVVKNHNLSVLIKKIVENI